MGTTLFRRKLLAETDGPDTCAGFIHWRYHWAFGHTPLSVEERIPWKCQRLVIGTGTGALPVMKEVKQEAKRRKVTLLVLPTTQAVKTLKQNPDKTNAILHVTC